VTVDRRGSVALVGAGPGDPDLITVRGRDRLLAAEVVIFDRLAPGALLELLGPSVELVDASRTPAGRAISQDEINARLVAAALAGKRVVRLKGGDPFVFGHGLEELRACTEAGVAVEVVPGVSSATAAPALAGISLTQRAGAQGFTVVSGHLAPDHPDSRLDWPALARTGATLVLLMAMANLAAIVERLLEEGLDPSSVATCVGDASLPTQRVVSAGLAGFAATVTEQGLRNPAVVIIEPVRADRPRRILVLGGSRSGKSAHAESLLSGAESVDYVATSTPDASDAEWTERIRRHQQRRPVGWRTLQTRALPAVLDAAGPAVLIDSVTTWLSGVMDDGQFWSGTGDVTRAEVDRFVAAWASTRRLVVAVSDEVGSGVVPETAAGRQFRDLLGELNQRLAAAADEVWLVTAGIGQRLR
jgi:uroporphyrin-III C-methyltransferase